MKQMKLLQHPKSFCEESLIISPKDYPGIKIGDIVEIYLPDDEYSRLLLQITTLKDVQQKDAISVEQTIANTFQLRTYADVIVNIVNPEDVALDSVELTFKDHYLARSDMWRMKQNLVNTCVYPNKKIEFHGTRCQVYEMWAHGEKVACGVITEDTKIVFRSASSMVYLFLQMSSEMWDFDINGDLYFEKAVNGFLSDLFTKWKHLNCNHDVTIVLFSRTFYEAKNIDEFPKHMQECIQVDYKNRFYEDFYRVAVQNERYEDWTPTLTLLKTLFGQYQQSVLEHHRRPGVFVPHAVNSTSSQGNFLEVLNMALNVFEKHFMDRSFDRTGQLSVVITPGVGVFEVDRELTNITKQRIIDNGIGSDLVCLGEQPLHAVPLFKFHNKIKTNCSQNFNDDYNMPHWINLSFYSSNKVISYANFVPRIKLPTPLPKPNRLRGIENGLGGSKVHLGQSYNSIPVHYDYDEYDSQVFKLPSQSQGPKVNSLQRMPVRRKSYLPSTSLGKSRGQDDQSSVLNLPESACLISGSSRSQAISIPRRSSAMAAASSFGAQPNEDLEKFKKLEKAKDDLEIDISPPVRSIAGSAGTLAEQIKKKHAAPHPRALINPFDPSHVTIKLTSNRRRWTHVFPLGPTGICMQQHHYQAIPQSSTTMSSLLRPPQEHEVLRKFSTDVFLEMTNASKRHLSARLDSIVSFNPSVLDGINRPRGGTAVGSFSVNCFETQVEKSQSWLWGPTGEQEWTPALTTGVDWKSLVIPACLPISTDYFPDKLSLQNDYVLSAYSLLPEDNISENVQHGKPLVTEKVYQELICQRLQQGFQIIYLPRQQSPYRHAQLNSSPQYTPTLVRGHTTREADCREECLMSIGRIFHALLLSGPAIKVTQYRPRHGGRNIDPIHYCYRFQAPGSNTYDVSWVVFASEKLETFNWSYLDHYICIHGKREYGLKDTLKYWRLRMLILPGLQAATRKIMEGNVECDIYPEFTVEDEFLQKEAFIKFLEVMNRIRRPNTVRKTKPMSASNRSHIRRLSLGHSSPLMVSPQSTSQQSLGAFLSASVAQSASGLPTAFRERGGSNRIHDRPRPRSGSRLVDQVRSEQGSSGRVSPATEADPKDTKLTGSNTSLEGQESSTDCSEDQNINEVKRMSLNTPYSEIIEAMKNSEDGLCFLTKQDIPPNSFVSAEATAWAKEHIEGIHNEVDAVELMQRILQEGLICHASGVKDHIFINGFYIYYIVDKDHTKGKLVITAENENADLEVYEREWVEVEFPPHYDNDLFLTADSSGEDSSRFEDISRKKPDFKSFHIDIDIGGKSDRNEWGQVQYHSVYQPGEAFELIVEWMVATGNIIADLVLGWARKAGSFGLQLVPIPSDPFALPYSLKSDPLRGPIFIPVDVYCLPNPASQLLQNEGLEVFQEYIVRKFGFIPLHDPNNKGNQKTFVHTTGGMFVMIPPPPSSRSSPTPDSMETSSGESLPVKSPHEEYILKHFMTMQEKEPSYLEPKIGFLWSWNYMITKRWKTTATIDEQFMRKVMQDFRGVCSNENNRLREVWDSWLSIRHDSAEEMLGLEN